MVIYGKETGEEGQGEKGQGRREQVVLNKSAKLIMHPRRVWR